MSTSERLTVAVRSDHCAGSGGCRALAPTVFGQDDHGWVTVLDAHPPASMVEALLDASDACPMGIIEVHDAAGEPRG